eukprot:s379_g6.t1
MSPTSTHATQIFRKEIQLNPLTNLPPWLKKIFVAPEQKKSLAIIISSGSDWKICFIASISTYFNQLFCTIWQSHQLLFSRHPTFLAGIVFQATGLGEVDVQSKASLNGRDSSVLSQMDQ